MVNLMKLTNRRLTSVALGYFDGVHLGHQAVLKAALNTEYEPAVLTFRGKFKGNLNINNYRFEMIKSLGIDPYQTYTYRLSDIKNLEPEEFVLKTLLGELNAKIVCCGYDFRFGKGGWAGADELTKLCNKFGMETIIVPPVEVDGVPVNSTFIRQLIAEGDIKKANKFLGYEHFYMGYVVGGNKLGRTIGFPTINQEFPLFCVVPRFGVYSSRVSIGVYKDGGFKEEQVYDGITNIGVKPTAGSHNNVTIETHIVGYDGDLYDELVKVSLVDFIRPERKFDSFEELKKQIDEDLKWLK